MKLLLVLAFASVAAATAISTFYTLANFNCTTYCNMVMHICNGTNSVYSSPGACMGTCAVFYNNASLIGSMTVSSTPPFLDLDTGINTFSCRAYHIEAAWTSGLPDVHCPHGGVASSQCYSDYVSDGYCSVTMATCVNSATNTASAGTGAAWDSWQHCYVGARSFQDADSTYNNTMGLIANHGNDLACRAYHVSVATIANLHCQHAAAASSYCYSTAVTTGAAQMCEGFCMFVTSIDICSADAYSSLSACQTACQSAAWTDATGSSPFPDMASRTNTMGCRLYHASVAASTGTCTFHCPHAGASSTQCVNAVTSATATSATSATGTTMASTTGSATTATSSASSTMTAGSASSGTTTTTAAAGKSGAAAIVPSVIVVLAAVAFA